MKTPELGLHKIREKKTYIIAAIIGAVTVSGVLLTLQNWETITKTDDSWTSFNTNIQELTNQNLTPSSSLFSEEEQPKFSIKDYLGYSAVERLINQQ